MMAGGITSGDTARLPSGSDQPRQ